MPDTGEIGGAATGIAISQWLQRAVQWSPNFDGSIVTASSEHTGVVSMVPCNAR